MFQFSLQIVPETFLVLRIIERDVIINVYWAASTITLFMSDFNEI